MEWNSFYWGACAGGAIWAIGVMRIFTKLGGIVNDMHKELARLENERIELHKIIKSLEIRNERAH